MLPEALRDNFFLGVLVGFVLACLLIGLWELVSHVRARRADTRADRQIAKAKVERAERDRTAMRGGGQVEPEVSVPPAVRPAPERPDAPMRPGPMQEGVPETAYITAQPLGDETQLRPAVGRPRPPVPPPAFTQPAWDGENRRSEVPGPYSGPERRGRHSDPEDRRRKRRDDPHDRD